MEDTCPAEEKEEGGGEGGSHGGRGTSGGSSSNYITGKKKRKNGEKDTEKNGHESDKLVGLGYSHNSSHNTALTQSIKVLRRGMHRWCTS